MNKNNSNREKTYQNINTDHKMAEALSLYRKPGSVVVPGDRVGSINQISSGPGTYIRGFHVYSSLVGKFVINPLTKEENQKDDSNDQAAKFIASVVPRNGKKCASDQNLSVGQLVLGRITRLSTQQASLEIIAADEKVGVLRESHGGTIRREDIRSGATEEIDINQCFRPGDVVICRILSLGDHRRYFLSTAESKLGVVRAVCESSGENMVPVSWKEMECPITHAKEFRKCARPS